MNIQDYLWQDSKRKIRQSIYYIAIVISSMLAISCLITLVVKNIEEQAQTFFIPASITSFSIYCLFYIIYFKGKKIAAIPPIPDSCPVSEQELNKRLEKINLLKLNHKLTKENNIIVLVLDRSGRTFDHYMEYSKVKRLSTRFCLKLDPKENRVLVQYYSKTIIQKKDAEKIMFFNGKYVNVYLDLFGWNTDIKYPFIVKNGELQISDNRLIGDGMEYILNLLMEIIVSSGWTWQPVFYLKN